MGSSYETVELQPAGWPIWPSNDPAADAQKRNKVLCGWLPVAAKELKSLLPSKGVWLSLQNRQLALQYINNMIEALEKVKENYSIIQEGTEDEQTQSKKTI